MLWGVLVLVVLVWVMYEVKNAIEVDDKDEEM
jgi:hypothetical protein